MANGTKKLKLDEGQRAALNALLDAIVVATTSGVLELVEQQTRLPDSGRDFVEAVESVNRLSRKR